MGLGEIISGGSGGSYQVQLKYAYRSRIEERLAAYAEQIAAIDARIANPTTSPDRLPILRLQRAAMQRLWDYYNNGMPADPTVTAWCADLTEDLTGNVGTIEIPGEPVTVMVRPGYDSRAVYSGARDGQLMPAIAGAPNQVLFNWMILPGWQRHKPIYRSGTIVSIDYDAHTATVCLDPAYSSQQNLPAVDGYSVVDCASSNPVEAQAADFCARNPTHPFCTNTAEGSEIALTDGQLAELQAVNEYVNQNYGRQNDPSGYRLGDSWDVMSLGGAGDCEDFALTKFQRLVDNYGWDQSNLKIVTAYTSTGVYHAMLAVRTSNRGLLILDVNNDPVVRSERLPYKIDKLAMTSTNWKNYTRQLVAVPVEYMECNSAAFVPGDSVVVEFTAQNWAQPKVIGFLEEPQPCEFTVILLCRMSCSGGEAGGYNLSVNTSSWTFRNDGLMPAPYQARSRLAGAKIGNKIYCVSGLNLDCSTAALSVIAANTEIDPATMAGTSKQAIPAAREALSGYGYGGKAWFAAGLNIGIRPWYGDEVTNSPGYFECPDGLSFRTCYDDVDSVYSPALSVYSQNNEYTLLADSWAVRQAIPSGRGFARGFGLSGRFFIVGGANDSTEYEYTCECCYIAPDFRYYTTYHQDYIDLLRAGTVYDPNTDAWSGFNSLPQNRAAYASASIGGEGYVFQGSSDEAIASGDRELTSENEDCDYGAGRFTIYCTFAANRYNPNTGAWASIQSLPNNGEPFGGRDNYGTGISAGEGQPAAAIGTKIVVCQTLTVTTANSQYPLYEYDPATNAYTARGTKSDLYSNNGDSLQMGEIGFGV